MGSYPILTPLEIPRTDSPWKRGSIRRKRPGVSSSADKDPPAPPEGSSSDEDDAIFGSDTNAFEPPTATSSTSRVGATFTSTPTIANPWTTRPSRRLTGNSSLTNLKERIAPTDSSSRTQCSLYVCQAASEGKWLYLTYTKRQKCVRSYSSVSVRAVVVS